MDNWYFVLAHQFFYRAFKLCAIVAGKLEYTTKSAHYFKQEVRDGWCPKLTKTLGLDPTGQIIDKVHYILLASVSRWHVYGIGIETPQDRSDVLRLKRNGILVGRPHLTFVA